MHLLRACVLAAHCGVAQEYGGVSFKAFDLGGHAAVRKLWTDYMTDVDAVVFVVDSNDAARHDEAREVRKPPCLLYTSPSPRDS